MSATSAAGPSTSTIDAIKEKARRLSVLSMMATTAAGSGHPTSCMSAAELVAGTGAVGRGLGQCSGRHRDHQRNRQNRSTH